MSVFIIFLVLLVVNFSCQNQPQSTNKNLSEVENKPGLTTPLSDDVDDKFAKQDETQTHEGKIKVWIEDTSTDEAKSSIYLQNQRSDKTLLAQVSGKHQKFTSLNLSPNGKWLIVNFEGDCKAVYEHKFSEFTFLIDLSNSNFLDLSDVDKAFGVKTNENSQGWLIGKPSTLRTFYKYKKEAKPPIDVQLTDNLKVKQQSFEEKFGKCDY